MERRESTKDVEALVRSQIRCRLGEPVKGLSIDVRDDRLVLSGRAPSYYAKQLAQHVAMDVSSLPLANEIEVG